MTQKLFKSVDNAPLILFRIFYGLVFVFESFGALATGWVTRNLVEPRTNFTFIGFEFLTNLMGDYMYVHFAIMGVLAFGVTFGYKYRFSIITMTIMWAMVYFMQKTSYNNHYYLMMLVGIIMSFLPANRFASVDARLNPSIKKNYMPNWILLVFIIQISCVYFYATVAKFYPDWLDGTVTGNMYRSMKKFPAFTELFQNHYFHLFIAYVGIAFDGLIVPALLWKRTRIFAVVLSLIFHISNSITLEIGVFPYFALALCVFFFPPEQIRRVFFKKKQPLDETTPVVDLESKKVFQYFFIPYLIIQVLLPIRHWFIKGDVLWTEEGHRLSWRMMLRNRSGYARFHVVDKATGEKLPFKMDEFYNKKQRARINTPDMIWQAAQYIKSEFAKEGKDVSVFAASSYVSINSKPGCQLIDPEVDLTTLEWSHLKHHDWILLLNCSIDLSSRKVINSNIPLKVITP